MLSKIGHRLMRTASRSPAISLWLAQALVDVVPNQAAVSQKLLYRVSLDFISSDYLCHARAECSDSFEFARCVPLLGVFVQHGADAVSPFFLSLAIAYTEL